MGAINQVFKPIFSRNTQELELSRPYKYPHWFTAAKLRLAY
jgi:hypothetical protein